MTMVDEAMALMSDGGTWTITPEKQGAADRFIARLREAIGCLGAGCEGCGCLRGVRDALAGGTAALDAIILATRTKAFTEGHAAGMQAAYDGEVTNAALAKARAEGRREGVEAAATIVRGATGDVPLTPEALEGREYVANAVLALLPSADAGPVAARWAARPVEERKALLADALSGEGITQGPPKGGPDAE